MAKLEFNLQNFDRLKGFFSRLKNQATVKIGIDAGASYNKKTKVADVAAYLEYGWTQRVKPSQSAWFKAQGVSVPPGATLTSPPRPFFELTEKQNRRDWVDLGKMALKAYGITEKPKAAVTKALRLMGEKASQDLQDMVLDGGTNFAPRSELTMLLYGKELAKHKTDGTPNTMGTKKPLDLSGRLAGSIKYEIKGI